MRVLLASLIALLVAGCASPNGVGRLPALPSAQPSTACDRGGIPTDESEVKVAVLNGTDVTGAAQRAAKDFQLRGFMVTQVESVRERPTGAATLRFGLATGAQATWVQVYLNGQVEMQLDSARTNDVIDVIIGRAYEGLKDKDKMPRAMPCPT